jgi:opacity protein-like surface antigen
MYLVGGSGPAGGNPFPPPGNPSGGDFALGGPVSFSMSNDVYGGLDAYSSKSTGYRMSDTAGLITIPNAVSDGFRLWHNGANLNLTVDGARLFGLGSNQALWFGLTGNFDYNDVRYEASAQTPTGGLNPNAGAMEQNVYTVKGFATYMLDDYYLGGATSFDYNQAKVTSNMFAPGATGYTNGAGYLLNATAGKFFPLFNSTGSTIETLLRGAPKSLAGNALFVDASAQYFYNREHENGFTDDTGFIWGAQNLTYSDIRARLKLDAVLPGPGFSWMPFVGVALDNLFRVDYTLDVPKQPWVPGNTTIFSPSPTAFTAEAGVNLLGSTGPKFGIEAYYQTSADTQTFGGSAYLKVPLEYFTAETKESGIRVIDPARTMAVKASPPPVLPAYWSWAGLYIGGYVGGALSLTNFSDPFGSSIYGDQVRSPGFLGGGQIGYNWQAPGSLWVFGLEADGSLMDSDGTNTCFAVSSSNVASTCRAQPGATSTLTGRLGYALDPSGRTLIYGKAGLAWATDKIDLALNGALLVGGYTSQSASLWGGTAGIGIERALSPAWSLTAEYDYVGFGRSNIFNVGNALFAPAFAPGVPLITSVTPPGTSNISQSFNEFKLGLNYKWGADPWVPGSTSVPVAYLGRNPVASSAGWEIEGGPRYFASWGQFQKNFGLLESTHVPALQNISRLTYSDLQTNSGELFGRFETPWNFFVKGYIGGGDTNTGHMSDEDFSISGVFFPLLAAYSNTSSPAVTGNIGYGAIDGGYDFLRGPDYRVGAFAGYFRFNQTMDAFGCVVVAFVNCTPNPVPTSGSPVVTENDKWTAVRLGLSGKAMLTERLEIGADVAWLPWVWMTSFDQHFVGNTGALAENISASGKGDGVQLDATLSYYLTPQWSVGIGGRYWGMWTTPNGNLTFTFPPPATAPQYFKAQVEQLGVFVQTSYKFDWGGSSVASLH